MIETIIVSLIAVGAAALLYRHVRGAAKSGCSCGCKCRGQKNCHCRDKEI